MSFTGFGFAWTKMDFGIPDVFVLFDICVNNNFLKKWKKYNFVVFQEIQNLIKIWKLINSILLNKSLNWIFEKKN